MLYTYRSATCATPSASRPTRRNVTDWVVARLYELIFSGESRLDNS
jgi:hypothetical protein